MTRRAVSFYIGQESTNDEPLSDQPLRAYFRLRAGRNAKRLLSMTKHELSELFCKAGETPSPIFREAYLRILNQPPKR